MQHLRLKDFKGHKIYWLVAVLFDSFWGCQICVKEASLRDDWKGRLLLVEQGPHLSPWPYLLHCRASIQTLNYIYGGSE